MKKLVLSLLVGLYVLPAVAVAADATTPLSQGSTVGDDGQLTTPLLTDEQALQEESINPQADYGRGYEGRWNGFVCFSNDKRGYRWWGGGANTKSAQRTSNWYCKQSSKYPETCKFAGCQRREWSGRY